MLGPYGNYKYYGYSNYGSGAGLNSLKVTNKGKRWVEFKDKHKIEFNFCYEYFSNSFWGTLRHESLGEVQFKDLNFGFECTIKFDSVKKKPTDYFSANIKLKNLDVCKVYGSYLSYIEFNGIRYWDIRENIPIEFIDVDNKLKSSSNVRRDRVCLSEGNFFSKKIRRY